jgi:NAD-reducing hydrogenase large subunit
MQRITIDPVTRIEGHAKITIQLGDDGQVAGAQLHITQLRGFEKFVEGRPFNQMPGITSRICGICPVSHLLASCQACDAIMAVRVPATGAMIRELVHCGQFIQSHALSFFHLSAPDLLLGMDSDPVKRNVLGLAQKRPELVRDGIELRKFGQMIIQLAAGERVHPPGLVPGGVMEPLQPSARDKILAGLPKALAIAKRTLDFFKGALDQFQDEIAHFGDMESLYAGLVDPSGRMKIYDGQIRFRNSDGTTLADFIPADQYREYIGEASLGYSYLKAPYFKQLGYPEGMYRVGPLARLNVADSLGTPAADAEFNEYRQRFGTVVSSSFLYHYARLIELLYSIERAQRLLETPAILDRHVRAHAAVNALEGVGMSEAPRGILIHHYKVDESGAITWANLIIATGHNNLALNRSIEQVSKHYVNGNKLQEGMLNRVSAVVRAYDPCLSCSTHADGTLPLDIRLLDSRGAVLDEIKA